MKLKMKPNNHKCVLQQKNRIQLGPTRQEVADREQNFNLAVETDFIPFLTEVNKRQFPIEPNGVVVGSSGSNSGVRSSTDSDGEILFLGSKGARNKFGSNNVGKNNLNSNNFGTKKTLTTSDKSSNTELQSMKPPSQEQNTGYKAPMLYEMNCDGAIDNIDIIRNEQIGRAHV